MNIVSIEGDHHIVATDADGKWTAPPESKSSENVLFPAQLFILLVSSFFF